MSESNILDIQNEKTGKNYIELYIYLFYIS